MGYRKEDIPQIIVALQSAKRHLWDGRNWSEYGKKEEYVCHAIREAGYGFGPAEDLIEEVLSCARASTFCDWWGKNVKPDAGHRVIQPMRRQWIDKMIADLQEYAK